MRGPPWTLAQDVFLRRHRNRPARWCGEQLDRTEDAVHHRRKVLGLTGTVAEPIRFNRYTAAEDRLILAASPVARKDRRGAVGVSEMQKLAKRLGRTYASIRCRRAKLLSGKSARS